MPHRDIVCNLPECLLESNLIRLYPERQVFRLGVSVGELRPRKISLEPGAYRLVTILQSPFLVPVESASTKRAVIRFLRGREFIVNEDSKCLTRTGWLGFMDTQNTNLDLKDDVRCPCQGDLGHMNLMQSDERGNNNTERKLGTWVNTLVTNGTSCYIMHDMNNRCVGVMNSLMRMILIDEAVKNNSIEESPVNAVSGLKEDE